MSSGPDREDVAAPESGPGLGEGGEGICAGAMSGQVGGVDGTSRGSDEQLGTLAASGQGLEQPDLHGAEAAAP